MKNLLRIIATLTIGMTLLSCAGGDKVVVASKKDTEGGLLGSMIVLLFEKNGIPVENKVQFGTTPVMREAIKSGEVDLYIEYTGNGAFFFEGTEPATWQDAMSGYKKVMELDKAENNIDWLQPANANNTWAIAVRKDLADAEGLRTLEDFARYVNGGGAIKLAASEEFVASAAALPSFQEAYGFSLSEDQLLTFAGGNTAQTIKAAGEGSIDDVNAAMAYGTDGGLSAFQLVVLEDTLGVQPVYQPAPIVRAEVLEQYPNIPSILNPVFASLDLETLQTLNGSIVIGGESPLAVAKQYLTENGYLSE